MESIEINLYLQDATNKINLLHNFFEENEVVLIEVFIIYLENV